MLPLDHRLMHGVTHTFKVAYFAESPSPRYIQMLFSSRELSCPTGLTCWRSMLMVTLMVWLAVVSALPCCSQTLRVHPDNPRILEYRGEPVVLTTLGEYYGSVINQGFNYVPYLNTLSQDGMNLTRVFLAGFHVDSGDLNDSSNPSPANFLQPWLRKTSAGTALDGGGKWDFSVWNEAYFTRLRSFVQACSDRGIVVELTLFSTIYYPGQWDRSPFNPANNVQGLGPNNGLNSRYDCMRPVNSSLYAAQQSVVRRIVREVNAFDNVYFEIQNEPFWNQPGVDDAAEVQFHNTMLSIIRNEESTLPKRHLVTHNFPQQINNLVNDYDMINCHYPFAVPSTTIIGGENLLRDFYTRNRPLSMDETTTAGPIEARLESWLFLMGGGAIYNGLAQGTTVYPVSNPSGTSAPGPAIRAGLRNLSNYVNSLDILAVRRDLSWLVSGAHPASRRQGMSKPGQQYGMYFYHGGFSAPFQTVFSPIDASNHTATLRVSLPAGSYRAVWTKPSDMSTLRVENFTHTGGEYLMQPVVYQEDVVVKIDRTGAGDTTAPPPPGGLSATLNAQNQILLNWSAAAAGDVANYRIYRSSGSSNPDFSNPPLATLGSGAITYVDGTATQGQDQRYVITAVDNQGNESRRSRIALAVAPITLTPPVANAGADQIVFGSNQNLMENVTLNGGASQPGARPIVSYVWQVAGQMIASGAIPTVALSTGIRDIQLTVTDDVGLSATDTVRIAISNSEFRNGSFENNLVGPFSPGGHSVLGEGLAGWTPEGETDALTTFAGHPATDGQTVLVFNGGGKAAGSAISQTFPTVVGRNYVVDLNLGVIAFNTSDQQRLTAQVIGNASQPLQVFNQNGIGSGANNGTLVWTARGFSFVADSTVSCLVLRDASPFTTAMDLVVDNVRVRAQSDRTLSLASLPSNGVSLVISPTDLNGASGGFTPTNRNFADGAVVTVTAPLISGGQGFRRWLSNGVDVGNANPITVTLSSDIFLTAVFEGGPPVILSQPVSLVKNPGEAATFSVSASGAGMLGYQWRFNQTAIQGANSATYQIPSVTGLNAGSYDVVISSSEGPATSQPAVLSVAVPDFTNGSFEAGLDGWQLSGNSFVLGIFPGYEASDGLQLIVFNGGNSVPDGSVSQTFDTVPGVTYRVFYDARIVAFDSDPQVLRLEVTGSSLLRATNRTFTGSSVAPIPWQTVSESFVADSLTTTVNFRDLSTKTISIDLLLDNVRVVAQSPVQFNSHQPPIADPQSVGTIEDTAVAVGLSGSGGNGPLAYEITEQPVHGTLSGTSPALIYTPGSNFHGNDSFRFVVADGTEDSAEATISIVVSPVNDPPTASAQTLVTYEDTPIVIPLTGADVDSVSLTYFVTGNPTNGSLTGTLPNLTYTPDSNFHGGDSFIFTVSDGIAPPVVATVSLTISAVNDAPLASSQSISTNEDTAVPITLTGTDVDGGSPTFFINGNPTNGSLTGTLPNLTYTPDSNFHGGDSFTFTVSDGIAPPVAATVSLTVSAVNDAPVANAQLLTIGKNMPSPVVPAGSDVDGDSLTFAVTGNPVHGQLSGSPPLMTYTPNSNYFGPDSISFKVSDGIAPPVTGTILLTVVAANEPLPTLRIDRLSGTSRLTLTPHAAGIYWVEWSDELEDWELLEAKTVIQAGDFEINDPDATGDRRFYRASTRP